MGQRADDDDGGGDDDVTEICEEDKSERRRALLGIEHDQMFVTVRVTVSPHLQD